MKKTVVIVIFRRFRQRIIRARRHVDTFVFLLLLYDICFFCSPPSVRHRVTQIKTYSWDNAQVILVGNKCDMEHERVISYERGKTLADELNIEFFETSAKDNHNVKVG